MTSTSDRHILIVVENLPVPLDRRVWLEATTLVQAGYDVSVISPMGRGWVAPYEVIDGVHIYRHTEPPEAHSGAMAYAQEYGHAMWHWFRLARMVWKTAQVRRDPGLQPARPDLSCWRCGTGCGACATCSTTTMSAPSFSRPSSTRRGCSTRSC